MPIFERSSIQQMEQQVVVIPLPSDGSLPGVNVARLLDVTGDFVQTAGPNLYGIVAKSGLLVVAQSSTGKLFRVDPATGTSTEIDLGGVALSSVDGLELQESRLFAVRNSNVVTVVRLGSQLASGTVGDITDPGLAVSTTGTVAAGRLWVVNARFGTGRRLTRSTGSLNCCFVQPAVEPHGHAFLARRH